MLSRFFVERPIFAWVVAIVIMLVGALAIFNLPVSQYPNIAPPQVTINATYPGASAETMSRTVTQVIEKDMTGLDGLIYMNSSADSTGRMTITLTFEAGTNPDIAQVQVQNKLKKAESSLPETVTRLGVSVDKSSASFLMVVGFVDRTGRMNSGDLGDFLTNNVEETLSRVKGVGEATVFGASYAMRIWMDPGLLMKYGLQPSDVSAAISAQNVQVAAGDIAGQPTNGKRMITATLRASSLMTTPEEFENITLKTLADGSVVRIKDIGEVGLGQETYTFEGKFDGVPSSGIAIKLSSGANALGTADRVRAKVAELSPYFPEGVEVIYPFDTTPFVTAALEEVVKTLIEAIILVVCVMYLFLQNWRATIIPTIAVPVVLLGTFGVLGALGYSINMLTMFALVLAIGLLVDDAIVVVENVERVMSEEGTDAKTATIKSMGQIQGALIGIAMVLSAVFIPMAFFGGSTGVIYRQFSVTIVSAMVLSVIVALTLTPALCAVSEAGEGGTPLGKNRVLRLVQQWVPQDDERRARVGRQSCETHCPPHGDLPRACGRRGLGLYAPAEFLHAGGRPGRAPHDDAVACGVYGGTYGCGVGSLPADDFEVRSQRCGIRLLCARILVCRYGSEQRHGLFEVERLERT